MTSGTVHYVHIIQICIELYRNYIRRKETPERLIQYWPYSHSKSMCLTSSIFLYITLYVRLWMLYQMKYPLKYISNTSIPHSCRIYTLLVVIQPQPINQANRVSWANTVHTRNTVILLIATLLITELTYIIYVIHTHIPSTTNNNLIAGGFDLCQLHTKI